MVSPISSQSSRWRPRAGTTPPSLASARAALDALDRQALAAVGVAPGITAGPVTVRTGGRLRLTPAAKAVITSIRGARKDREAGLGIVLNALLALPRPDPAADPQASAQFLGGPARG